MILELYVHFAVIFKNTKNIILSVTFGVMRWEHSTAATILAPILTMIKLNWFIHIMTGGL